MKLCIILGMSLIDVQFGLASWNLIEMVSISIQA